MADEHDEGPKEQSSSSGRLRTAGSWMATSRTTGVAAAVFGSLLAVIVIVAVVIALTRGGESNAPSGSGAAEGPAATAPAEPKSEGELFGAPSADLYGRPVAHPINPRGQALPQDPVQRPPFKMGNPVQAPEGMMWQQVGPFVLPFSTSDGPSRVEGPIARGYTRSPQGAALAAWQANWRLVIDEQSLDAVYDNQIESSTRGSKSLWAPKKWIDWSKYPPQYRPDAFRVTGWTEDASYAVIEYAARDKAPNSWFTTRFEVVWQDGDWKLRRPVTAIPPQSITSLAGWTQW